MNCPRIVAVGGFTSDVGKTTLMCELIAAFPGWEAIKTTRGHYRSCGKDPHSCCVSHLLKDEPVILSGREQTYTPGKDTGRYWDAGARNVHWMIAAEEQVEKGIKQAIDRVRSAGVFVEGNSFTQFIDPDAFIMVAPTDGSNSKGSARRALSKASALYLSSEMNEGADVLFKDWRKGSAVERLSIALPVYTQATLADLIADLRLIDSPASTKPISTHPSA